MDIAIVNSWLLTFQNNSLGIVKDGAIGIEDGKISFVGKTSEIDKTDVDTLIDGSNHVTMPGLVNAHIHTSMTLLRGGAQDLPEIEWMNKGIGPIANHMKPSDIIVGSKLGVIEALRSGTTTFAEYSTNVSKLVDEIYLPFGARVVATETINEVSKNRAHLKPTDIYEFDRTKGEKAFKQACELFKKYQKKELVTSMFGPQALDMISLELLQIVKDEAIERKSGMHLHVAQGERERLQIVGRFGKNASTVKVLNEYGFLDEYLLGAHCHDTSIDEREKMVSNGVKMVGCPSSISMIDGIVPPVGHFVSLGGKVGLGSDQAPGPGLHNMFCEMRTISIITKTMMRDPTALPAWEVLKIATGGGSQVLGLEDKIGSLEVGKQADIITIDLSKPNLTPVVDFPFHTFIPNIVYSATGYEVDNVIISGKEVIIDSKFVSINEQEIINDATQRSQRIFRDASEDWMKADSLLVKKVKNGLL